MIQISPKKMGHNNNFCVCRLTCGSQEFTHFYNLMGLSDAEGLVELRIMLATEYITFYGCQY